MKHNPNTRYDMDKTNVQNTGQHTHITVFHKSITTKILNSCRDTNSFHQIKSHVFINRAFDAVSKLEGKIKGKRQTIPHHSIIFLH